MPANRTCVNRLKNPLWVWVSITLFVGVLIFLASPKADAATGINQQLNFQGRLLNNAGAVIADGDYHMEFEVVQDGDGCNPASGTYPCSGTVEWTETWTGGNLVRVRNGYFSVQLGSITPFGSNVDWNQDTLWLSINIGGTGGSPTWDGAMKPLKRLTATPYAFNSLNLGGLAASSFVQLAQGLQADASTTNASIAINKTGGTANILTLQRSAADVLTISNSGLSTFFSDVDFTLAGAENVVLTSNTGSSSADVLSLLLTNSDGGANTQRGLVLTIANDAADATTEAGIVINNLETTSNSVTDYILITTSSADSNTDAIDVSDADLFNAINIGTNFLVASGDSINDFTGNGLAVSGNALGINLTASGTSGSTSSNSGLEVSASGLTMLKGCADNQLLKWTDAGGWACSADNTGTVDDLDTVYAADANKTMTVNNASGLTFNFTTAGLFSVQDNGLAGLTFDTSTSRLRVYENTGSPTNYLELYYDNATSTGIIGVSSGTVAVGSGTGPVTINSNTNILTLTSANTGTNALDVNVTGTGGDLDIDVNDAITIDAATMAFTLAAGSTDFTIAGLDADSNVILSGMGTDANAVLYTTTGGVLTRVAETETGSQCLLSGAGASGVPVWGSCAGGSTPDFDVVYAQSITNTNLNMEIDNTGGLTFDLTTTGDFAIRDGTTAFATFNDDSTIAFNDVGTLTADFMTIVADGATTTTGANALQIDFTTGNGANPTNSGLEINLVSGGTAAGDIINGINLTMDAADASTQNGLVIGANFDNAIIVNSGDIITSNLGVNFTDSDTNPGCAAGEYKIFADTSETRLKKCMNGTITDLDTSTDPDTAEFQDTTSDTLADANANLWDGTQPNITPTSTSQTVLALVTIEVLSAGTDNEDDRFMLRRNIGADADCTTAGGSHLELTAAPRPFAWSTDTAERHTIHFHELDAPATTSQVRYTVCSSSDSTGTVNNTTPRINVSLIVLGADLAENYYTRDESISAGDIVSIDSSLPAGTKKSARAYDPQALGIVSTQPAKVLDDWIGRGYGRPVPVALSGRVPVKVNTENGPIRVGDYITSSSTPGIGMKATKAGQVVGQAMTGYAGEGIGSVFAFVKTSYFTGAGVNGVFDTGELSAFNYDLAYSQNNNVALSGAILRYLTEQRIQLANLANLSEVYTDRVVAGLEMVTPRLTADSVSLNSIEAATSESIKVNGDIVVNGTIFADKIRANQIEGLEILTDKISSLQSAASSQQPPPDGAPPVVAGQSIDLSNFKAETAEITLDLTVGGLLSTNGGLLVEGPAHFNGESIFEKLVTFENRSLFKGGAEFAGRATFNSDSGGFALIKAGQSEVKVEFQEPYEEVPVVTLNIKNGLFAQYAYKDLTENGFTIILKDPVDTDVEFAWSALSVKDAELSKSLD